VRKGSHVVITFGPFTGCEGTIVSRRKGRVVLRLQPGQRFLQIELAEDMVRRTAHASRKPAGHSNTSRPRAAGPSEMVLHARVAGSPRSKAPSQKSGSPK
jgi:hypothetical protein